MPSATAALQDWLNKPRGDTGVPSVITRICRPLNLLANNIESYDASIGQPGVVLLRSGPLRTRMTKVHNAVVAVMHAIADARGGRMLQSKLVKFLEKPKDNIFVADIVLSSGNGGGTGSGGVPPLARQRSSDSDSDDGEMPCDIEDARARAHRCEPHMWHPDIEWDQRSIAAWTRSRISLPFDPRLGRQDSAGSFGSPDGSRRHHSFLGSPQLERNRSDSMRRTATWG